MPLPVSPIAPPPPVSLRTDAANPPNRPASAEEAQNAPFSKLYGKALQKDQAQRQSQQGRGNGNPLGQNASAETEPTEAEDATLETERTEEEPETAIWTPLIALLVASETPPIQARVPMDSPACETPSQTAGVGSATPLSPLLEPALPALNQLNTPETDTLQAKMEAYRALVADSALAPQPLAKSEMLVPKSTEFTPLMQELNAKVLNAKPRLSDAVTFAPLLEVSLPLPENPTERENLAPIPLPIPTVESHPPTQNGGFQDSRHDESEDETLHTIEHGDTTESLRETARFAESLQSRTEEASVALPTKTQTTLPSDRVQIIEQLRERVESMRLEQGRSEMTLHLRPDHLGEVHILLSSGREGVSARIVAENSAVQQALESAKETLRAAFENKGLPLIRFEVALANGGFAEGRPDPQAFQEPPRPRSRNTASVRALQSATPSNQPLPTPAPALRDRRSQLDYAA